MSIDAFATFSGVYTLAEIIEIEDLAGCPIDAVLEGPWGRPLLALTFVLGRRTNPELTLDEASLTTLDITIGGGD